jgi:DNA polymerase/3'-5' exonuclease PolX
MTTTTMTFFTIDTLQFSKRLQKAGLNQKIAEELSEAIKETQNQSIEGLATKHDIALLKKDIQALEQNLNQKIESVKNDILIKMFFMISAAIAIITWLNKVIN